jgi:hypothetical protein
MGNINFNFFDSNSIVLPKMPPINFDDILNPPSLGLPKTGLSDFLGEISDLLGKFDEGFSKLLQSFDTFGNGNGCGSPNNPAPIQPPSFADSCQPQGSLQKTGDNAITTAGGYKIEMTGQFEWKITGPDGKTTRVWGDPHVDEGDGGKWDFKRDSTFVLGDGTRINVGTTPYGNGMTVTQKLEIISGNDRIVVNDIDKGKGKIGDVTKDGYASVNNFAGKDVFVMGKETDDWSYQGREVIGSNNGGETFNLGGELAPPTRGLPKLDDWANQFLSFFKDVMMGGNTGFSNRWIDGIRQNPFGANPYAGNNNTSWESNSAYDRQSHLSNLQNSFAALGRMFESLSRLAQLSRTVDDIRMRQRIA